MAWAWHDIDLAGIANDIEAMLWLGIAVGFLVSLRKPGYRKSKWLAAANFAVFGASDIVEAWLNDWPLWVFGWKVACVGVMFVQLMYYTWAEKRKKAAARGAPP